MTYHNSLFFYCFTKKLKTELLQFLKLSFLQLKHSFYLARTAPLSPFLASDCGYSLQVFCTVWVKLTPAALACP